MDDDKCSNSSVLNIIPWLMINMDWFLIFFSSELQLEMQRREQRKLQEEQEELEKWRKKIEDRQREDEEFKVCNNGIHKTLQPRTQSLIIITV